MSSDGVLSFVATTDRSKFPPVSARRRPGLIERSVRKPWPENVDVRFLSRAVNKRDGTPDGFRNRGRFKLPLHYPVQPSRYLYAHVRYRSYTPNREISSFPNVIFGKSNSFRRPFLYRTRAPTESVSPNGSEICGRSFDVIVSELRRPDTFTNSNYSERDAGE